MGTNKIFKKNFYTKTSLILQKIFYLIRYYYFLLLLLFFYHHYIRLLFVLPSSFYLRFLNLISDLELRLRFSDFSTVFQHGYLFSKGNQQFFDSVFQRNLPVKYIFTYL